MVSPIPSASSVAMPAVALMSPAGGGPAGMMLGLLLARQGQDVVVLEKHADFLRDFRGDTVHPSTLELVAELGWLEEFLRLPHTKLSRVTIDMKGRPVTFADFGRLPTRCRYVAFMPQWDFLDFLADKAGQYSGFRLVHRAEVTDLIEKPAADRLPHPYPKFLAPERAAAIVDLCHALFNTNEFVYLD